MLELIDFVTQRGQFKTSPVSFTLKPRQLLHVLGPNGSGKSTLLDGIGGFAKAYGDIIWGGMNIGDWTPERRHKIIFARHFQNPRWDISASDLLSASGYDATVPTSAPDAGIAAIKDIIEDIQTNLTLSELSFGQRRRIMLASAMLRRRPILLLDEPLEGIDERNTHKIQRAIRTLLDFGAAAVLVEHVPSSWDGNAIYSQLSLS